jgi:hypothetical protein
VAALAVACGRGKSNETTALNADLKRDLDAASATSVELANTARDYKPTRFVSAIESPTGSVPVKHSTPRKPVKKPAAASNQEVARAPDPAPEAKVEATQTESSRATSEAPAPVIDTPTQVAVQPRPTPVGSAPAPTDAGTPSTSGGGGLGGIGEAIGTVIGVVIVRGGAGGIDHCDPRTDGRGRTNGPIYMPNPTMPTRGGGIIINNPMPRGRGFPRR